MFIALPIQGGIIYAVFVFVMGRGSSAYCWDGRVTNGLRTQLLIVCAIGLAILVFGVLGSMPEKSPGGNAVHGLSAYFVRDQCFAEFNKAQAIEMPAEFCESFNLHFFAAFCGVWMFFSAPLYWMSLKRRSRL
jgi:hypothetical protein